MTSILDMNISTNPKKISIAFNQHDLKSDSLDEELNRNQADSVNLNSNFKGGIKSVLEDFY